MPADPKHDFRYEPELCSLSEDETLTQWRRAREEQRAEAAPRRRRRRLRRTGVPGPDAQGPSPR